MLNNVFTLKCAYSFVSCCSFSVNSILDTSLLPMTHSSANIPLNDYILSHHMGHREETGGGLVTVTALQ